MPRTLATNRQCNLSHTKCFNFDGNTAKADFGATTFFDSTLPFAFELRCDLGKYYNSTTTGVQGLLSFKTDQGVPWIVDYGKSATVIVVAGASSIFARIRPTTPSSLANIINRGWHDMIIIFDGVDRTAVGSFTMYVDGVGVPLTAAGAIGATTHLNTLGILGGTFAGVSSCGVFRTWNGGSAMTAQQVADLAFRGIKPTGPTLTHEYLFTEGAGTTLADTAGSATGTITTGGGSWSTTTGPFAARTIAPTRTIAGARTLVS